MESVFTLVVGKPDFSVSAWGPVVNGKVVIKNAYFSPNVMPATLS